MKRIPRFFKFCALCGEPYEGRDCPCIFAGADVR